MMTFGELLTHSLLMGAMLSAVLTVLIVASLLINKEMWLSDFPPDVQAAWGAISPGAKRQRNVFAAIFFATIIGGVWYSLTRLDQGTTAPLTFGMVFFSVTVIFQIFNLVDALFIDMALFKVWPSLMILPGTEGMAGYADRRWWAMNLLKGVFFSFVVGLIAAVIVTVVAWIA